MGFPDEPRAFDTMLGVPSNRDAWQGTFGSLVRDPGSQDLKHPAGYMFNDLPEVDATVDYDQFMVREMDRWGVQSGLVPVGFGPDDLGRHAIVEHPGRFHGSFAVDPNDGPAGVVDLTRAVRDLGAIAAACFPSGTSPQVAINDASMYPLYAACVELDVPLFVNTGVPGPRFPMATQHVAHLDEVCYDFPDLVLVSRHGGEPWTELMVKLMLKWPGLHYSTSAFAPKHYPKAIIDYANSRGGDKVMYAGYFPMGLSLERIFTEMPRVALKDDRWEGFLRGNARRVLKLDG